MVDKLTFRFTGGATVRIGGAEIDLKASADNFAYQGRKGERALKGFKHDDGTFFRLKDRGDGGVDVVVYGEPALLSKYHFKVRGGDLTKARIGGDDFRRDAKADPVKAEFSFGGNRLAPDKLEAFLLDHGLMQQPALPLAQKDRLSSGLQPDAVQGRDRENEARPSSRSGLALIQGQDPEPRVNCRGLGYHYTSWGTNYSLGKLTTSVLKIVTLSPALRWAGAKLQGGHSKGARYVVGAAFKGLGNLTSGLAGLVGGTVSWGEALVSNLGGTAIQLLRGRPSEISFFKKGQQQDVTAEMAKLALPKAVMASAASSLASDPLVPDGYPFAPESLIPRSVLSREHGGTGELGLMKYESGRLVSDHWSALRIGVFVGPRDEIYLAFAGTKPVARPGTLKSNAVQFFGIKDTAFNDADKVVRAFKAAHPDREINLIGHSLGGAIATYAGIKNGVPVTGFNSAGLSLGLRNELGADAIDAASVVHLNTAGDPLSQYVQNQRFGVTGASQVGIRYRIPESKGHRTNDVVNALTKLVTGPDSEYPGSVDDFDYPEDDADNGGVDRK